MNPDREPALLEVEHQPLFHQRVERWVNGRFKYGGPIKIQAEIKEAARFQQRKQYRQRRGNIEQVEHSMGD